MNVAGAGQDQRDEEVLCLRVKRRIIEKETYSAGPSHVGQVDTLHANLARWRHCALDRIRGWIESSVMLTLVIQLREEVFGLASTTFMARSQSMRIFIATFRGHACAYALI